MMVKTLDFGLKTKTAQFERELKIYWKKNWKEVELSVEHRVNINYTLNNDTINQSMICDSNDINNSTHLGRS